MFIVYQTILFHDNLRIPAISQKIQNAKYLFVKLPILICLFEPWILFQCILDYCLLIQNYGPTNICSSLGKAFRTSSALNFHPISSTKLWPEMSKSERFRGGIELIVFEVECIC